MTRMTRPDCVVMCNLINTHTHIHTNGGDFGGTRKICRKGSVGPVAANSNIVEINKEAGGGAQGTLSLSKNCTSRESVSPLSRLCAI